jgi:hypothetical protein
VSSIPEINLVIDPGYPDFTDLPWRLPLTQWGDNCQRIEEVTIGVSRHPVVFVNYSGVLYCLKELPTQIAEKECRSLQYIHSLKLPAIVPVGYGECAGTKPTYSVLITQFLENSIPYLSLFMSPGLRRYRDSLLDAMAGLLVQLHLAGVYWGDCSLSNTLFRRDAGALQAYLVDAETTEVSNQTLPPLLRHQELDIMENNVNGELEDLGAIENLIGSPPAPDAGGFIRRRYQRLWEEVTHEDLITQAEQYRIQERIRSLNTLGYSIGNISLLPIEGGNQLRFKLIVTDRNFHRNQLFNLTALQAEERQARYIMNEIQEVKAVLSRTNNRSTPVSVAAHYWLENYYLPTIDLLNELIRHPVDGPELYCQVLENKWFLSEKAQRDVGHHTAAEDYLVRFGGKKLKI